MPGLSCGQVGYTVPVPTSERFPLVPALTSEVKLARRFGDLLSPSFSPAQFVAYLCMSDMWVKRKFLDIVVAFIDHNAERWFEQTHTEGEEDFFIECARVSDAMNAFRYN